MTDPKIVSIDANNLYKGQTISSELVWNYFTTQKPETYNLWITQYGDEITAKAARMPIVLQRVIQWIERDRNQADLPPLVMNTVGGCINVLTDERASEYLNNQAFSGLRKHQKATGRLIKAVDETKLSGSARREHQNRINVHSFIAASTQGAQKQLKLLKSAGKQAPKLEGS